MNLESLPGLLENGPPQTRETVTDCLIATAFAALGMWIEGNNPIATEVDHLVRALQNENDPLISKNPAVGMVLRLQLPALIAAKESARAPVPQENP